MNDNIYIHYTVNMSNCHHFKLQFQGRIWLNCRGLNNKKRLKIVMRLKIVKGESSIKYN